VTTGVEANCLLIDGYLLIGGDPAVVREGARVTVHGRVDRDLMTTSRAFHSWSTRRRLREAVSAGNSQIVTPRPGDSLWTPETRADLAGEVAAGPDPA
jgi:hypothetical protein